MKQSDDNVACFILSKPQALILLVSSMIATLGTGLQETDELAFVHADWYVDVEETLKANGVAPDDDSDLAHLIRELCTNTMVTFAQHDGGLAFSIRHRRGIYHYRGIAGVARLGQGKWRLRFAPTEPFQDVYIRDAVVAKQDGDLLTVNTWAGVKLTLRRLVEVDFAILNEIAGRWVGNKAQTRAINESSGKQDSEWMQIVQASENRRLVITADGSLEYWEGNDLTFASTGHRTMGAFDADSGDVFVEFNPEDSMEYPIYVVVTDRNYDRVRIERLGEPPIVFDRGR
jgi:hypothetical protein